MKGCLFFILFFCLTRLKRLQQVYTIPFQPQRTRPQRQTNVDEMFRKDNREYQKESFYFLRYMKFGRII